MNKISQLTPFYAIVRALPM